MPGFGTGVTVWFCSCLCWRRPVLGASAISLMGWSLCSVWTQNSGLSTAPHNQLLVLQGDCFLSDPADIPSGLHPGLEGTVSSLGPGLACLPCTLIYSGVPVPAPCSSWRPQP